MKKQVVFVHGGESKQNYKDFFDYLYKVKYEPFKEKQKKWKDSLELDLGDNFEFFKPSMPNKYFADYEEWKIMFEKVFPFLKDDVILIGHSLGGTFLIKYLEENSLPVNISKIFIIAGAFKDSEGEGLGNFNFDKKLEKFKKYEQSTIFYHSKDDLVVPFSDLENFRYLLPSSDYKIFEDKFHFIEPEFPELIEYIKRV